VPPRLANTWIDTDPDGLARAAGAIVLTTIAGGAIWCGLWALLSKTFTRQSHFSWHVRVFVVASFVLLILSVLPPLLAFAFSWPWLTDFSFVAVYAATAIYFHLLAVEPRGGADARRCAGLSWRRAALWFNVQRTGRPGEELMYHLFRAVGVARRSARHLRQRARTMTAVLDRRRRSGRWRGDERGDDDEE
jgi:hypothetical protein